MCFPIFWLVLRFSCLNSCTVQPQPHNKHNETLCNQYCASLAYRVHDCTCTGSLLQWYPKLTCNMSGHRRAVRMLFQPSKGWVFLRFCLQVWWTALAWLSWTVSMARQYFIYASAYHITIYTSFRLAVSWQCHCCRFQSLCVLLTMRSTSSPTH